MVTLNFNLLGFAYQQGVDWLEAGFTTAAAPLRAQLQARRDDLKAYEDQEAAGGERIGEWEDGLKLWEQDEVLEMHIDDAEEALMDLRKAYALAAYHHWERSARRWTRAGLHAKHPTLVKATQGLGYPVSAGMPALYDLVNTLKHNSAKWATALADSWPEVLKADPSVRPDQDWYTVVELSDDHVHQICEIIRGSGPDAERLADREPQAGDPSGEAHP